MRGALIDILRRISFQRMSDVTDRVLEKKKAAKVRPCFLLGER